MLQWRLLLCVHCVKLRICPKSAIDYRKEYRKKVGRRSCITMQLKTVVGDDLPARLCSEVVCVACRGSIIKATKQEESFEHQERACPEDTQISCLFCVPETSWSWKTPPRLPSKPEKRPWPSPLARTGISFLTKRPPLAEAVSQFKLHNVRGRNQLLVVNCSLY